MLYKKTSGVPAFEANEWSGRQSKYCLCIPIINEGERILKELQRAQDHGVDKMVDIIICDGGSTDGSMDPEKLKALGVNTLLIKRRHRQTRRATAHGILVCV